MQNTTANVVQVPANVWHTTASTLIAAGKSVANGFFQCVAPDGSVWTITLFVPAIFAGNTIITPAPLVP